MAPFDRSARPAELPVRRGKRSRMGAMLAQLGLKAAPGWCPLARGWDGGRGTQAGQATEDRRPTSLHGPISTTASRIKLLRLTGGTVFQADDSGTPAG